MNYKHTKSWLILLKRLWSPNRKYKDRLFQRVFRDKEYLLELYNAINGTTYSNVDDLEITTLEDVIFMSMKNDTSFIISSTMNLYEHQSTINPNMPIRGLLYFAQLYDEYIKLHGLNIYGRKLVKLPTPQYIVFYNGKEEIPDYQNLFLTEAFERTSELNDIEPALECRARIINVNDGHNAKLMSKCKRLMHYSQFIARINQNIEEGMSLQIAIDEAIDYCLANDILADILIKNRSEVSHMLLTEFNEKKFAKTMWEEGHQSGFTEGHESGFNEGRESGYDEILNIMNEIKNGNDTLQKLIELGYNEKIVKQVLERM